jgi:transposase
MIVSMKELMDTKATIAAGATAGRRVRRTYPLEEKLRIVEQTKRPGMSVSRVARESGVNTNLVFTWRRQYAPEGLTPAGRPLEVALLPIQVAPGDDQGAAPAKSSEELTPEPGFIEIKLAGGSVRVHGRADGEALAQIIGLLRRR